MLLQLGILNKWYYTHILHQLRSPLRVQPVISACCFETRTFFSRFRLHYLLFLQDGAETWAWRFSPECSRRLILVPPQEWPLCERIIRIKHSPSNVCGDPHTRAKTEHAFQAKDGQFVWIAFRSEFHHRININMQVENVSCISQRLCHLCGWKCSVHRYSILYLIIWDIFSSKMSTFYLQISPFYSIKKTLYIYIY